MGACVTKLTSRRREKRKSCREARSGGQKKTGEKHEGKDSRKSDEDKSSKNQKSGEGSARTRKTLRELRKDPPPAFRKFESEVDWETMDEEIAFQLWEDVFKPLYTF